MIGGSSDIAPTFEVHEMTMEDGVAKMRPVKGGLEIKPGETVEFKPGSYHVMFVGLKKPLSPASMSRNVYIRKGRNGQRRIDVRAMGASSGNNMPGMQMQH